MAVFLKGMTIEETVALTKYMMHSGKYYVISSLVFYCFLVCLKYISTLYFLMLFDFRYYIRMAIRMASSG